MPSGGELSIGSGTCAITLANFVGRAVERSVRHPGLRMHPGICGTHHFVLTEDDVRAVRADEAATEGGRTLQTRSKGHCSAGKNAPAGSHMRTPQLLACGSILVLASVGLAPASSAQDYIGSPLGAGSDEIGPGRGPGSAEHGDYVGLPGDAEGDDYVRLPGDAEGDDYVGLPGDAEGDDYVGLPGDSADGDEYVGVAGADAAAGLSPPLIDLGERGRGGVWAPVARIHPPEQAGRSVQGLPVSTSDVVLLGGLATVGLALAARRARVAN